MKKILLVSPDYNPEETKVRYVHHKSSQFDTIPITPAKSFMVPLALVTLHALTPDGFDIDIWDEGVHGPITLDTLFGKEYDLVGVTGYVSHTARIRELGRLFRERGILTACGGPDASASPDHYRDYFDVIFIGEAEHTWPQFLADWESGRHKSEYRQVDKPDMGLSSPPPRWDKIVSDLESYAVAAVQTTRGCPFDCNFCDVVSIYGRDARHKSVEQVIEEVRALERLGVRSIFFCDDNFMGNPRYAKDLLRALIPVNNGFLQPIGFHTQITLNCTEDDKLLRLLADANFTMLFIGVETPNSEALKGANKKHNLMGDGDILSSVRKVHSYGMVVQAGMIVGFDEDTTSIFRAQFEFLQASGIGTPVINVLKAPPRTKLWAQMHQQGRIVRPRNVADYEDYVGSDALTNLIPKQMTLGQLVSGYRDLVKEVRAWPNFEARVMSMLSQVDPSLCGESRDPRREETGMQIHTLARFLFSVDSKKGSPVLRLLFSAFRKTPSLMEKLFKRLGRQYMASVQAQGTEAEDRVSAFVHFLSSMDSKTGFIILRLLLHTFFYRPFMMGQVLALIGRQYMLAAQMSDLDAVVEEQIRLAEEGAFEKEPMAFFVPDEFRKIFPGIFPGLYDRVRNGLDDKSRTLNALVEVTYDFLTRWASTFNSFEKHHREQLNTICDSIVAGENSSSQGTLNGDAGAETLDLLDAQLVGLASGQVGVRLQRWAQEVLRSAEQKMHGLQPLVVKI